MPLTAVSDPLIGASLVQVWKPALDGVNAAGSFYDKFAPFTLGTTVHATPSAGAVDATRRCSAVSASPSLPVRPAALPTV